MLKTLLQFAKRAAARIPFGEQVLLSRAESHSKAIQKELGLFPIFESWVKMNGWTVQAGPFAGMQYRTEAHGSVILPKLVGSDEAELHATIRDTKLSTPLLVVDIGAAEGYYAMGFAMLFPKCRVVAFETSWAARRRMLRLARANNVADRLRIFGKCRSAALETLQFSDSIVVSDCEGAERHLLDPSRVGWLSAASLLLIELHEEISPGVTEVLMRRFERTHTVTLVHSEQRRAEEWLSHEWRGSCAPMLLSEWRNSHQEWLIARRKTPE